jgi:hypothetical protein
MAELRKALPPEELEIYEKCYRFFQEDEFKRNKMVYVRADTAKVPHIEG